jgi:hypothetical protein
LNRYFVSQSSEFCRHNPLKGTTTSNTEGSRIFLNRLSPESFGYTLVDYLMTLRLILITYGEMESIGHGSFFEVLSLHTNLFLKEIKALRVTGVLANVRTGYHFNTDRK